MSTYSCWTTLPQVNSWHATKVPQIQTPPFPNVNPDSRAKGKLAIIVALQRHEYHSSHPDSDRDATCLFCDPCMQESKGPNGWKESFPSGLSLSVLA